MTTPRCRIAITGANGFIGKALCSAASDHGLHVLALTRSPYVAPVGGRNVAVGEMDAKTQWQEVLDGCDVVVHLAAYQPSGTSDAELDFCRRINVEGTANLALQAAFAGVRRFVFMSSVKVYGELSPADRPFTEADIPTPTGAYGVSKWEAEKRLQDIAAGTNMEVVIVRAPLVYGRDVGGNFQSLVRLSSIGFPLPLASIKNKRSLVSQANLLDFVLLCCFHPRAAGEVFLVSDMEDVSVPELIMRLGGAVGAIPKLFPVPVWMLKYLASAIGKGNTFLKITGNLQVSALKAQQTLGWKPPQTLDQGIKALTEHRSP